MRKRSIVVFGFIALFTWAGTPLVWSDQGVVSSAPSETAAAAAPAAVAPSGTKKADIPAELLVQAIRLRAEKMLAAKRRREAWKIYVDADVITKHESNPDLDQENKGDFSIVEDASLTIKKFIYGPFTGQFDYFGSNTHYNERRDNNSYSNSAKGVLITDLPLDLQSKTSYEFEHLYYAYARNSTVYTQRIKEEIKWRPNRVFTWRMWWEYQHQQYKNREARFVAAGTTNISTDNRRQDKRQKAAFEASVRKNGWTYKARNEFYRNFSNDTGSPGEPYDKWFYKWKGTIRKKFNKKVTGDYVFSYDYTDFVKKGVTAKSRGQFDHAVQLSSTWTYKFNKRWKMKYKLKWKIKDSNDNNLDYQNLTNQVAVYFSY